VPREGQAIDMLQRQEHHQKELERLGKGRSMGEGQRDSGENTQDACILTLTKKTKNESRKTGRGSFFKNKTTHFINEVLISLTLWVFDLHKRSYLEQFFMARLNVPQGKIIILKILTQEKFMYNTYNTFKAGNCFGSRCIIFLVIISFLSW